MREEEKAMIPIETSAQDQPGTASSDPMLCTLGCRGGAPVGAHCWYCYDCLIVEDDRRVGASSGRQQHLDLRCSTSIASLLAARPKVQPANVAIPNNVKPPLTMKHLAVPTRPVRHRTAWRAIKQ
jgi:hypothetical protein